MYCNDAFHDFTRNVLTKLQHELADKGFQPSETFNRSHVVSNARHAYINVYLQRDEK